MKNRKRKDGFAKTKGVPSTGHPAYYRKTKCGVEFIPFTHSNKITLKKGDYLLSYVKDKLIITIPLKKNINPNNPKERGRISYALPFVFVANRKMLGKELTYLKLSYEDKKIVLELFDKLPRINIKDYYNSKK